MTLKVNIPAKNYATINAGKWSKLKAACVALMEHYASDEYGEDETSNYEYIISDVAMELVYGPDFTIEIKRLKTEQDELAALEDE